MDAPLLTDDFKEFLRLLNAHHVDYLVVGGYAVGVHGYPRATVDLDVWVRSAPDNAPRVVAALRAFGFDATAPDPTVFLSDRTIVRFGTPPFRIELMTSIDGVRFEACAGRAFRVDIDGTPVPFISLADLRANKLASGRHKDLNDLENLP
jgi:hypothetical protein